MSDLPGLGNKKLQQLAEQGFHTLDDLLHITPEFIDANENEWSPGDPIQCVAQIKKISKQYIPRRGQSLLLSLETEAGHAFKARFFKAHYLTKVLREDLWYIFTGSLDKKRGDTLIMPKFQSLEETGSQKHTRIYKNTPDGVSETQVQKWISTILKNHYQCHDPLDILDTNAYTKQLYAAHQSEDESLFQSARRCIALREACGQFWRMRAAKMKRQQLSAPIFKFNDETLANSKDKLPFDLSTHQEEALNEMLPELCTGHPSMQLLQGDVGSGKSAIAFILSHIAISNNYSVVYLAPTQMLARQQFELFNTLFKNTNIKIEQVIAGSDTHELAHDKTIYIGTHALFNNDFHSDNIGIVIIDEQHKFGVQQRESLILQCRSEDYHPHVCMLSATPIPQSLARCSYGDLQLVNIKGRPQTHGTVHSKIHKQTSVKKIAELIQESYAADEQSFIICPYIKSDYADVLNANTAHKNLLKLFPKDHVALLHSQCSQDEQDAIHHKLQDGSIRIVVATSIIEVGLNVVNATSLVICNAERFGLAQLHQMRGRIGRGNKDGTCYFLTPDPQRHKRLQALIDFDDGFTIAEEDLKQRGIGDLVGSRQHGMPNFYSLNFFEDNEIIQKAFGLVETWQQAPCRQLFSEV